MGRRSPRRFKRKTEIPRRPAPLKSSGLGQAILRILADQPDTFFGIQDLFRQLELPRRDFDEYCRTLESLIAAGKVTRTGRRQVAARPAPQTIWGVLRLTPHGYGFLDREDGSSVFISAREAQAALDGDRVQVEIRDRGHEAGPEGAILEVDYAGRPPLLGQIFRHDDQWRAEVKSGPLTFTAAVQDHHESIRLRPGDWALLRVSAGRRRWPLPVCRVQKLLGNPRKKGIAEKGLLASYGFTEDYPQEALAEALGLKPLRSSSGERRDLRDEFVVTIDPADAKDHDDAVSLRRDRNGTYHLGVHIADVSRYVPEGSAIDREARRRAFSVYLLHHHLPMLPPRLPGELCSLKPGKDRLALSALIDFDGEGKFLKAAIVPSLIRVSRLLSYEEAQGVLDSPQKKRSEADVELSRHLRLMWELASKLRRRRLAEGGVDFDLPEPGFHWEDGAAPSSIFRQQRLPSHQLIEEFMLAANRAVAEVWAAKYGEETANVFRVHPPLEATRRQKLVDYLAEAGFDWPPEKLTTAKQIAQLLDQARRRFPQEVVSVMARKALSLARYDAQPLGHFGLGFARYVHFTSPIRRYADLTVHRLIWSYLVSHKSIHNGDALRAELEDTCRHLSQGERIIAELEREANKLAGLLYLEEHREETLPAILVEAYQDKLFVGLVNLYMEGALAADSGVRFRSRRAGRTEMRRRTREPDGTAIGDRLKLNVSRIDLLNRKLELKPANKAFRS